MAFVFFYLMLDCNFIGFQVVLIGKSKLHTTWRKGQGRLPCLLLCVFAKKLRIIFELKTAL